MLPICILAIRDDDDRAYMTRLFVKYQRLMYRTIYDILGDKWATEDVLQTTLLRLIDQGYHLESDITVGNMSGGSGKKKICKHISVTPEDIEAFRKLDAMQYHLYQQTVPSETPAPFMKHLEDALAQG